MILPRSLYIHLPFCRSQCTYCDFVVAKSGTPQQRTTYLEALETELKCYLPPRSTKPILHSLFLGGGTPSRFTAEELASIFAWVSQAYTFTADTEITMELNPEQPASSLSEYRALGINRLSIGVQSMQPQELKALARLHRAETVIERVQEARQAGFENLSLDLMVGLPYQTPNRWQATLTEILTLEPEHISVYGLQLEPGTALDTLVTQGRMQLPHEDTVLAMMAVTEPLLAKHGYERYEISNYARPGFHCRHNLTYWQNHPFWGFGVGAHGYVEGIRYETHTDLHAYLAHPTERPIQHQVSRLEALENTFIFGLRTWPGVHLATLETTFGPLIQQHLIPLISPLIDQGLMRHQDGYLSLTAEGMLLSNAVLESFIGLPESWLEPHQATMGLATN